MGRNNKDFHVNFNEQLGKSFRVVTTPPGRAKDSRTGETLPDSPDRWSIVTPSNGKAWEWPTATPKAHEEARKDFNNLFTDRRLKYKGRQIRKNMK